LSKANSATLLHFAANRLIEISCNGSNKKTRIKRSGNQLIVTLPDTFVAEEVDVLIWPSTEEPLAPIKKPNNAKHTLKYQYSPCCITAQPKNPTVTAAIVPS